ncbi:MAG: hypothetical protein MZV70_73555 [Desulfobacterales bacterium]|nr:hypothetical protein [Desulfobacterales bacterium]
MSFLISTNKASWPWGLHLRMKASCPQEGLQTGTKFSRAFKTNVPVSDADGFAGLGCPFHGRQNCIVSGACEQKPASVTSGSDLVAGYAEEKNARIKKLILLATDISEVISETRGAWIRADLHGVAS